MNSFSHYSFGAVAEWMFRDLAGIDQAEAGFRRIIIKPRLTAAPVEAGIPALDWVKADYDQPVAKSPWSAEGRGSGAS